MRHIRNIENRAPFFYFLCAMLVVFLGGGIAALTYVIFNFKIWGHWIMDAASVFVLLSGVTWVALVSLFSDITGRPKITIIRVIKISFCAALVPGILMAAVTIYAAWDHNPDMSIHSEGFVDWSHLILIGSSWLIVVSGLFFILFSGFSMVTVLFRNKLRTKSG